MTRLVFNQSGADVQMTALLGRCDRHSSVQSRPRHLPTLRLRAIRPTHSALTEGQTRGSGDLYYLGRSDLARPRTLTNRSERITKRILLIAKKVVCFDIWSGFIRHGHICTDVTLACRDGLREDGKRCSTFGKGMVFRLSSVRIPPA